MTGPAVRISPQDLNRLLGSLEVSFVALTECLVSEGFCLEMGGVDAPGIHYNIQGSGKLVIKGCAPVELKPHTLVIVPSNAPFRIEADGFHRGLQNRRTVDGLLVAVSKDSVNYIVAGDGDPEVILICGFFDACYGSAVDLFSTLTTPIVEQFSEADRLDTTLKNAIAELVTQEVGSGAMSSALLKLVIVHILRRSLYSNNTWVERFSLLRDPQIARAFAEMASNPGAPHTVNSLAQSAYLGRSAFMARFTEIVGQPPMNVLRDLRMRQAAEQLQTGQVPIEQVVRNTGYESRSSFARAFRKAFGMDPSEYRAASAKPKGAPTGAMPDHVTACRPTASGSSRG
ncbi:AraC family transcriptional regulator [Luteibacter jiangsuensis]|uniref:AraC family transcriptional regulator n=1 Tax=Luteibacter jiangsuensis TaxID=637577 RepID=UPI0027D92B8B|nr:AraC family transcriptional regulator [Luteibacter jiangsuensis]